MSIKVSSKKLSRIQAAVVRVFGLEDHVALSYLGGAMTSAGVNVTPETALKIDAFYAGARMLSQLIATLPLSLYVETSAGAQVAREHSLHRIIHDTPNSDMPSCLFWEAFFMAMLMRGEGHAEKLYFNGNLVGLEFLSPNKLNIICKIDGKKEYQYQKADGTYRKIPADRIFKVPGFTLNGKDGVPFLEYAARTLGIATAAEEAASRSFANGGMQNVYYKVSNWLRKEQRDIFKTAIQGSIENGQTPLLEGGTTVDTIGIKPSEAQLLESRAFSVESICRLLGLQPWMLGHTEKSTSWGTGIEQQMIGFLTFTVSPWAKRIEQSIKHQLLPLHERDRYFAKFTLEGLLRADSAARADFYNTMTNNGIMTRDEAREKEDLPPMGGNAAKLTVQSAMTTLDSIGQPQETDALKKELRALLNLNIEG